MKLLALILGLAFPAYGQNLSEPQYNIPGIDYSQESSDINQMFRNIAGDIQVLKKQLTTLTTSGVSSGNVASRTIVTEILVASQTVIEASTVTFSNLSTTTTYRLEYQVYSSSGVYWALLVNGDSNQNYGNANTIGNQSGLGAEGTATSFGINLGRNGDSSKALFPFMGKAMISTVYGSSVNVMAIVQTGQISTGGSSLKTMTGMHSIGTYMGPSTFTSISIVTGGSNLGSRTNRVGPISGTFWLYVATQVVVGSGPTGATGATGAAGAAGSDGGNTISSYTATNGGILLGPSSGATEENSGLSYPLKSEDGTTQSSGCVVSIRPSIYGPDFTAMTFSSTNTTAGYKHGVLLETCAPGAVCRVKTNGPARVRCQIGLQVGRVLIVDTGTRCQGDGTTSASTSSAGQITKTCTGAGGWGSVWLESQ